MRISSKKSISFISICGFAAVFIFAAKISSAQNRAIPAIIPQPVKISSINVNFTIKKTTTLIFGNGVNTSEQLDYEKIVDKVTAIKFRLKSHAAANYILLGVDSFAVKHTEGYVLSVTGKGIRITGHDAAGLFYGLQTLTQLIKPLNGKPTVPGCSIEDYPRFAYRGMNLDVSRHIFPAASIKKWLDILALFKINTFHWHLTDDQGWRIEIKKYPLLQSVAAYRKETLIGHKKDLPHVFDGKPYGGYYTQAEVKSIVNYAAKKHIEIIPEIEMPGHALAALAAYPALGCTGGPYQTATFWGVFDDVYCAGNEQTFTFLQNVLNEVVALFPSKYIHIGGDECPKTRWIACPKCRQRIKDEHLKDEHELQSYFIRRIENYLTTRHRKIIGWDEILEGGLSPGATVMSWTGEEGGIAAARQHHDAIMCPEKFVYLDYYQSLNTAEPIAAGGYTPLSKIYGYEPVPKELTATDAAYIKGVQANVWSEYIATPQHAEYMMFPRVLALAEIAWSVKEGRNYADFLVRLNKLKPLFKKLNINTATNFNEITDEISRDTSGKTVLTLRTTLPGGIIRYTVDGSIPGNNSKPYLQPLLITATGTIKAVVFNKGHQYGRVYQKQVLFDKAIGKNVMLTNPPQGSYNPGNTFGLVNGITGTARYNDGQWFGFSGNDLDAVIDLDKPEQISSIGLNILKYHWQKMWEPANLTFSVSTDGKNYIELYNQDSFPVNGINKVKASFLPVTVRYVKIQAKNKGIIPSGEYGAGGKAWLLTDEFIIN